MDCEYPVLVHTEEVQQHLESLHLPEEIVWGLLWSQALGKAASISTCAQDDCPRITDRMSTKCKHRVQMSPICRDSPRCIVLVAGRGNHNVFHDPRTTDDLCFFFFFFFPFNLRVLVLVVGRIPFKSPTAAETKEQREIICGNLSHKGRVVISAFSFLNCQSHHVRG